MTYNTGTIRQTHQRLLEEGMNISENTLRVWVRQKVLPAAFCGKKAYIYYPNVLELIKSGTSTIAFQPEVVHGIRKIG